MNVFEGFLDRLQSINGLDFAPREDEYEKDGMLYCKKCNTARLFVRDDFKARCICQCQKEELEKEELKRKQAEKQRRFEKLQEETFLSCGFFSKTFEATKTQGATEQFLTAFTRTKKYTEVCDKALENGWGIYLFGDVGVGKTHLMACMINALTNKMLSCLIVTEKDILNMVKGTFGRFSAETEKDVVDKLVGVDFLFLDDLGTERYEAKGEDTWAQGVIYDIIDKRSSDKKPTVFSSNYSIKELYEKRGIAKKTVDRIAGMSNAVLEIRGKSHRIKNKEEIEF